MSGVVLLVEDNPTDEKLTLLAFRRSTVSIEFVIERDGAAALDFLFGTGKHAGRDARDTPALVLLDLNLPKLSGHEVLRRIRADARTKHVPVIILTSSDEDADVRASYALGSNAYVRKPLDFDEFARAAESLGVFWLRVNTAVRPRLRAL